MKVMYQPKYLILEKGLNVLKKLCYVALLFVVFNDIKRLFDVEATYTIVLLCIASVLLIDGILYVHISKNLIFEKSKSDVDLQEIAGRIKMSDFLEFSQYEYYQDMLKLVNSELDCSNERYKILYAHSMKKRATTEIYLSVIYLLVLISRLIVLS